MNLDLSFLGWIHTAACLAALVLGGLNLAQQKGTALHRRIGQSYLWAILILNITSLGIYHQNRGFFFPHWLAIATICLACIAFAFAHFKRPSKLWLHGHITSIVLTYYLLLGGGVNEAFLRIAVLRGLSGGLSSPLVGATHLVLMAITALALIWFNMNSGIRRSLTPSVHNTERRENSLPAE